MVDVKSDAGDGTGAIITSPPCVVYALGIGAFLDRVTVLTISLWNLQNVVKPQMEFTPNGKKSRPEKVR